MKNLLNISNIYILLWCLYSLQGVLYAEGGIVSRLILSIVMLVSFYYFVRVSLQKNNPIVINALSLLVVMFTIYGVLYIIFGQVNALVSQPFSYLKLIYISLLPIYPFYSFSKQGLINEHSLKIWTPIFFLVAIACFYKTSIDISATYATRQEMNNEMTNNTGYIFLSLIPLTLVYKERPVIQYSFLATALVFILLALKRGAILIVAICILWIIFSSFKNASTKGKIGIIVLSLVLVVALLYFTMYLYSENEYLLQRIDQTKEGDSSDRDILYAKLFNYYIYDTSILQFLFGSGAYATINIAGNAAHNDWLEIAVDNGLIGVILYIIYWISLLNACKNARPHFLEYMILTLFFIITFLETIFSMSYNSITIYLSISTAWALASLQDITQYNNHE